MTIFNFRVEKEKQQLIIEIDSVSSSLDAAVKAKVSACPIFDQLLDQAWKRLKMRMTLLTLWQINGNNTLKENIN